MLVDYVSSVVYGMCMDMSMEGLNCDWLTVEELCAAGFWPVSDTARVSRKCSLYGISGSIGEHVRVDDFCILKGNITLHDYVHLAAFCMISGAHAPVTIGRHVGISTRLSLFTGSDDYSANTLGGPTTPSEYTTQIVGPVSIGTGTMIGAHCVILPGVTIGVGASIGAGCIVGQNLPDGGIVRAPLTRRSHYRRDYEKIQAMADKIQE